MMSSLTERDRKTLQMGGIAAGVIVVFMIVVSPLMDRLDQVNKKIDDRQKALKTIVTQLDERVQANRAVQTLATQATIYPDASQLNRQTSAMLDQIEKLKSYPLLAVRRLEGLPLSNQEDYYRSAVTLQFSGSLANVQQFLKEMEAAEPRLKVERMNLAADQKSKSLVEGQMVISAYAVLARKGKNG